MENAGTDSSRFIDDRRHISRFADEFLVVCPRCEQCARVIRLTTSAEAHAPFGVWRLVCPSCGHSKDKAFSSCGEFPDKDWFFQYPLWLNVNCAGGTVWAYNWRHLTWIEDYVRATRREKRRDPQHGWSNQSAANRLPEWIKSAKNRDDVLHGIEQLKQKAGKAAPARAVML